MNSLKHSLRKRWPMVIMFMTVAMLFGPTGIASAAGSVAEQELAVVPLMWWLGPIGSIVALVFAYIFYRSVMEVDEGTPRMIEIAQAVRDGASAYLRSQYRVVAIVFAILFVIFLILAYALGFQNKIVPFAFLTGGFFSALCGFIGMKKARSGGIGC